MEREYDVVVIGTGVAGSDIAWHCRKAGMRVAIADCRDYGGTCALRGCVPKRVLAGAAAAAARVRDQQGNGIRGEVVIDWPRLVAFERTFTDPVPQRKEGSFREAGIHTYHGLARFVGLDRVAIGDDTLTARHIVVAAGAHPRPLEIPGADLMTLSDDFFYLEALPERIVFVGGGYISFEFAHVAAAAGSAVTILQRSGRVLSGFDPDIVDRLVVASEEIGIDVQVNMPLLSVERNAAGLRVRAGREGEVKTFDADMVVHGAGRVSAIEDLDLAAGNVETDGRGIVVDEYLRSVSNPAVYVAGDANAGSPQLTPVAVMDAHIVVDNILGGNARVADYSVVPSAVFTTPPLASVGLTEAAAMEGGIPYIVNAGDLSGRFTNRSIGQKYVSYKLLIDGDSRRILGAHLIGPHVEEVINIFALAIRHNLTVDDLTLDAIPWAYPSSTYDIIHMVHPLVRK
ncbi:MAG: Pyridine nucleotide-disulfide oxidoreductase dimerization region [Methanoculleus marisnigri]|uniref:Pyridine nucleotide-disulfide oxidoreductase dimerization region n=1 Tax=Methanoculleus marisnigri TaxID=2198 RepID=A0A117MHF7_9EURY|nr:NAD(P)/FAD-dependent oxidoreductase [Methanoculleus marisnigri]KUK62277.1 MAG: Pyridine nucleotide-disulfide oxidoreductase dimerization region [Methanoculleus marisnigri]KUL04348.1 MAG: Pyridine nucleotide-disulfide oxidoreductase dimerization region [Methanoculleus marisnigri]